MIINDKRLVGIDKMELETEKCTSTSSHGDRTTHTCMLSLKESRISGPRKSRD